ncbi:hypothetical protein MLD38_012466 [Melastoma candidum]|uniref:Uncharacterized protein n=1 Tax=Melastoma candidum TaxID=119954 RepID=A0ACB9R7Q3_9MYRT|nr:hypothetical protein MLD38_012466 [Melastoma candidum]
MDQPWESLDVDDSDLASFLPPNPRLFPPLAPCSSRPASASIPSPSSPSPVPTPIFTDGKRPRYEVKIPGPAGAVQSAMRRRSEKGFDLEEDEEREGIRVVGTQEYLRRAVECGSDQEDFHFEEDNEGGSGAWFRAIEFVRERGLVEGDGVTIGTPLCNIKRGVALDKVSQVVAIIKSCAPNGLGDLLVTLKDPTGTINASIHRKVLLDKGFGKDIAIGAVLILQKVAVFSPVRSSHYINITLNNIVQVISKDGKFPSARNEPSQAISNSSNPDEESSRTGKTIRASMTSSFRERENEAENNFRCIQSQQSKATRGSRAAICSEPRTVNTDASTQMEPLPVPNDVASNIGITRTNSNSCNNNVRGTFASLQAKLCSGGVSFTSESLNRGLTGFMVNAVPDDKGGNTDGKENLRQASVMMTSIPEWTDEQLDELLEFD